MELNTQFRGREKYKNVHNQMINVIRIHHSEMLREEHNMCGKRYTFYTPF